MRIYLAGPMRGIKDFNFPAFHEAAKILRDQGHSVFSPADNDEFKYGKNNLKSETGDPKDVPQFSIREALAEDTNYICLHADAIVLLPNWRQSKGALMEYYLASALDLLVFEFFNETLRQLC